MNYSPVYTMYFRVWNAYYCIRTLCAYPTWSENFTKPANHPNYQNVYKNGHNLDAVQQPWNGCTRCTLHVAKLVIHHQLLYFLCLSPFYNYLQAVIGNRKAKEKWEANVPLCWVPPSPESPLYVDSDIMCTCSMTAGLCVTAGSALDCISKHFLSSVHSNPASYHSNKQV